VQAGDHGSGTFRWKIVSGTGRRAVVGEADDEDDGYVAGLDDDHDAHNDDDDAALRNHRTPVADGGVTVTYSIP